jgi:hypothetical protein
MNFVSWITIKIAGARWEAELMQQILASHDIPSRVVNVGASGCFLTGETAVQVLSPDRWTALLLLSPKEEELETDDEFG